MRPLRGLLDQQEGGTLCEAEPAPDHRPVIREQYAAARA